MKLSGSLAFAAFFLPLVLAFSVSTRTDVQTITDQYLFDIILDQFIEFRDAKNPTTLDWTSDGCTKAPENPLGFDFEPACYRHDFGYANYREQSRFTKAAKNKIDSNFLSDLEYQCETAFFESACNALAKVYHAAAVKYGGKDATKRGDYDAEDVADYEEKLAIYERLLAEAQASS